MSLFKFRYFKVFKLISCFLIVFNIHFFALASICKTQECLNLTPTKIIETTEFKLEQKQVASMLKIEDIQPDKQELEVFEKNMDVYKKAQLLKENQNPFGQFEELNTRWDYIYINGYIPSNLQNLSKIQISSHPKK